jgi:alpha-beta hydrolase superfamily lysophospholipase
MGALITLDYVIHDPAGLKGAIISGAPLRPVGVAKPHLIALVRLLSGIWPTFTLPTSLDASVISRDPEVVRAYKADPLVHGRATARWGAAGLAKTRWLNAHVEEVHLPILMIHGSDDRIGSADGARAFFDRIPVTDKRFRAYAGGYHEPHNDVNHTEVLDDVAEWIETHLALR